MIDTQDFTYVDAGLTMTGQIAKPSGPGPHPGVLVMHSALGLDDLVCRRARDLAESGYIALATDMYGVGRKNMGKEEVGPLFLAVQENPDLLRSRAIAGFDARPAPCLMSTPRECRRSDSASAVSVRWSSRAAVPTCARW